MMTLILGGARSGKSRLAQKMAAQAERVTCIATAQADSDAEMSARIRHHREQRPEAWRTIEEPLELAGAVELACPDSDIILVDCLTLWLSNLFFRLRDNASPDTDLICASELQRIALLASNCHIILVSNELGSGTVPDFPLTRAFRDAQGFLNQRAAAAADEVILTVAGLPLCLKSKK